MYASPSRNAALTVVAMQTNRMLRWNSVKFIVNIFCVKSLTWTSRKNYARENAVSAKWTSPTPRQLHLRHDKGIRLIRRDALALTFHDSNKSGRGRREEWLL